MEVNIIKVYVKVDSNNVIKDINSSIFIQDLEGWINIDEGEGDKYSHAQGNYLENGLLDMQGKYNYKLVEGKIVELTEEEKTTLFPTPAPQPSSQELLNAKILKDSLDIKMQLANQQKLNADLLLKLSKLGGVTNV